MALLLIYSSWLWIRFSKESENVSINIKQIVVLALAFTLKLENSEYQKEISVLLLSLLIFTLYLNNTKKEDFLIPVIGISLVGNVNQNEYRDLVFLFFVLLGVLPYYLKVERLKKMADNNTFLNKCVTRIRLIRTFELEAREDVRFREKLKGIKLNNTFVEYKSDILTGIIISFIFILLSTVVVQ